MFKKLLKNQPQYSLENSSQSNNEAIMIGGGFTVVIIMFIVFLIFSGFIRNPFSDHTNNISNDFKSDSTNIQSSSYISNPSTSLLSGSTTIQSVNCVGEWDEKCSTQCGDGTQTYRIKTPKQGNGISCPFKDGETIPCKIKDCDSTSIQSVDCVGKWYGKPNDIQENICSEKCGDGILTYSIITPKQGNGKSCQFSHGTKRPCKIKDCDSTSIQSVNCVGEWDEKCSTQCGDGTQTYRIKTPKQGNGISCPFKDGETIPCKIKDCDSTSIQSVDCVGKWYGKPNDIQENICSEKCGDGILTYSIITPPQGNGKSCQFSHGTKRLCKIKDCCPPLDCSSQINNFKNYYDIGKIADTYIEEPIHKNISTNKTSDTQCDVTFNFKNKNNQTGFDKRFFSLLNDNNNCTWNIKNMTYQNSGINSS